MKTWLITGCSSGFGKNLAETLLSEGEQVVVTARKPETIQHFAEKNILRRLYACGWMSLKKTPSIPL